MKTWNWLLIALMALINSGCATAYRTEFLKEAKTKGWTEEQQLAALAYSDRVYFLKNKGGDGKESYEVNYSRLSKTAVREKLDKALEDLNQILNYENEEDAKYVDEFGLRNQLEHDEEVFKAVRDRVRAAELYDHFRQIIGAIPSEYGEHVQEKISGYDIKQIFVSTDPAKTFFFSVDQIEEAKKRGALKVIEQGHSSLQRKLDRKEKNPTNPNDTNDFIWKSRSVDVEFVNYKILDSEKPEDNEGNYLEGYRIINGKRESLPALRIIYLNDSERGVFLLDLDKEGETGFGLPDIVDPVNESVSVNDLMRDDELLDVLFKEKKEQKRVPPKKKPIRVEIAKIGPQATDLWENAPNPAGWTIPFRYKNALESNYNIKVVLARQDSGQQFLSTLQEIKYIKKEWTLGSRYEPSMGKVVEYYRPKAPYNKRNLAEIAVLHNESTKKVYMVFEDGEPKTLLILPKKSAAIEDRPVMIEYSEGQKRWRLKRENNSDVFDKRKEVSPLSGQNTGNYSRKETE